MWIRKTPFELAEEKAHRKQLAKTFLVILSTSILLVMYFYDGVVNEIYNFWTRDLETFISVSMFLVLLYCGCRSYVLFGSFFSTKPMMICIGCQKGLGGSDDGWGFRVFGRTKKWYQVKSCATPNDCDIAYQYEVKWDKNIENPSV